MQRRALTIACLALVLAVAATAAAAAAPARWWPDRDVAHFHLKVGPLRVDPGQNVIRFRVLHQRPKVDGYITSFVPNLVYAGPHGSCSTAVPRVDVIHLHHGVWLINGYPTFAAGEEKTRVHAPQGFGYRYRPSDEWMLSYMVHNLTPQSAQVCLTYDLGFIPRTSRHARGIVTVRTQNMTVVHGLYPVFDVHQGSGIDGTFTYPTQANDPYAGGPPQNTWTAPRDETITGAFGHLHPGGLYDSIYDTRVVDGSPTTVLVFRARAHYFEPAGAVSWDVAMTTPGPSWRVAVRKGDVLSITSTYDSSRASWYEAMGITALQMTDHLVGGVDPFTHDTAVAGVLNHGHLAENDHHGGGTAILPDATTAATGPLVDGGAVAIDNFIYGQGDLTLGGAGRRPPAIHEGQSLTFVNDDALAGRPTFHTVTSCRAPCNAQTGIAYPLANGPGDFDSGELGLGGPPTADRVIWSTPPTLAPGTYSYFCRVHPFMRGSFRVLPAV
jgi:hypothetical protein